MARLIITSPDGKRGILELNKPVISIGRGSANDLVLNDGSEGAHNYDYALELVLTSIAHAPAQKM